MVLAFVKMDIIFQLIKPVKCVIILVKLVY